MYKKKSYRKYLYLVLVALILLFYVKFTNFSKLTCEKLKSDALCIEIDILVKTDDWLIFSYLHKFPNHLAHNDEIYIKSLSVINNANKKTKITPYTINFVPLEKKNYEKTPYSSENVGAFTITVPSLNRGDNFRLVKTNFNNYDIYINGKLNNSYSHWYIDLFRSGEWKIEHSFIGGSPEGETDFNWIINGLLNWGGTFNVMSTSEFYNVRNNRIMILITIAIGITTIIVGIYSIINQKKLAIESAKELRRINDNIIKTNKENHLNKQLSLLISFKTELELIISNLNWFSDLLDKHSGPLHEMWNINPSIYLSELYNKVNGINLKYVKETVIWINQKISLINIYRKELMLEGQKVKMDDNQIKILIKNTKAIIKEILDTIEKTKKVVDRDIKKLLI